MTIDLIVIGKTDSVQVAQLVEEYSRRVNFYVKFSLVVLPDVKTTKKLPPAVQKQHEGEALLRQFAAGDHVVLLDENGASMRSVEFAAMVEKRMTAGLRRLYFVVGGPYGFSDAVYARADGRISLSPMTFSHQIVRAIFAEQLYRALTIINREPYHHE
jgi:23S rRNA (pseudouridine1915-N3)-methyltransferase